MMSYITRINYARAKKKAIHVMRERIHKVYPTWDKTRVFMKDVRAKAGHKTFFAKSDVEDVLEHMHDQYGRWQDQECQDLKGKLVALEDRSIGLNGSGRVRMTDLWQCSQGWQLAVQ